MLLERRGDPDQQQLQPRIFSRSFPALPLLQLGWPLSSHRQTFSIFSEVLPPRASHLSSLEILPCPKSISPTAVLASSLLVCPAEILASSLEACRQECFSQSLLWLFGSWSVEGKSEDSPCCRREGTVPRLEALVHPGHRS